MFLAVQYVRGVSLTLFSPSSSVVDSNENHCPERGIAMSKLTLENFQINMEEVYLPAHRAGNIFEQHGHLIGDIKELVSNDNRWVGLMTYLLGDDNVRSVIAGDIKVMTLMAREYPVLASRLYVLSVASTLGEGGGYDDVIADATRAVILDKNNEVAKLVVIDLLQGKSMEQVKSWLGAAADDAWVVDNQV